MTPHTRTVAFGAVLFSLVAVLLYGLWLVARAVARGGAASRAERLLSEAGPPADQAARLGSPPYVRNMPSPGVAYRPPGSAPPSTRAVLPPAAPSPLPGSMPQPLLPPAVLPSSVPILPPAQPYLLAESPSPSTRDILIRLRSGLRVQPRVSGGTQQEEGDPQQEKEEGPWPLWIPAEQAERFDRLVRRLQARPDLSWQHVQEEPDRYLGVMLVLRGRLLGRVSLDEEFVLLFSLEDGVRLRLRLDRELPLPAGSGYRMLVRVQEDGKPQLLVVIQDPTVAERPPEGYTGLLIDARELKIPSLANPLIVTSEGHAVIGQGGPDDTTPRVLVGSYPSLEAARGSGWAGAYPMLMRAVSGGGDSRGSYLVILPEDAARIEEENERSRFLEKGRVLVVIGERSATSSGR